MIRDFPLPPGIARALDQQPAPPGASDHSPGRSATVGDVPVRDAATVMLVRDGAAGVETFLFRRVASMVFAAGMHVFPGGRTDDADADPRLPWQGPPPAAFAGPLGASPDVARKLVAAAVRETFEECGVLLASPPGAGPVTGLGADSSSAASSAAPSEAPSGAPTGAPTGAQTGAPGWQDRRQALLDGRTTLADLLLDAGLVLRADVLTPWARWVTPPAERRRYDTRFFLVPMPAEQSALDLGGEGEHAQWLPAADAVRRWANGEARLLPPTVVTLEELAAAPDVAALRATPRAIRPLMPWVVTAADGARSVRIDIDGLGGGDPEPAG